MKRRGYIYFNKEDKPDRANLTCQACAEKCKQHVLVKLIECPHYTSKRLKGRLEGVKQTEPV